MAKPSDINRVEYYHHEQGRLFVVGDLHGCYDTLMQELQRVNFNFQQDLLIAVGDLVDRGAESLKCLNLTKEPWFKSILGNHEEMCMLGQHDVGMADLHAQHGGEWFYELPLAEQHKVIQQCQTLPLVLEVQYQGLNYGFVHGDIEHHDWNTFKAQINDHQSREIILWGRSRIRNSARKKIDVITGIDYVFLGHTVVDLVTKRHNCYFIDTGAVFGAQLTVLEIDKNLAIEQQLNVIK